MLESHEKYNNETDDKSDVVREKKFLHDTNKRNSEGAPLLDDFFDILKEKLPDLSKKKAILAVFLGLLGVGAIKSEDIMMSVVKSVSSGDLLPRKADKIINKILKINKESTISQEGEPYNPFVGEVQDFKNRAFAHGSEIPKDLEIKNIPPSDIRSESILEWSSSELPVLEGILHIGGARIDAYTTMAHEGVFFDRASRTIINDPYIVNLTTPRYHFVSNPKNSKAVQRIVETDMHEYLSPKKIQYRYAPSIRKEGIEKGDVGVLLDFLAFTVRKHLTYDLTVNTNHLPLDELLKNGHGTCRQYADTTSRVMEYVKMLYPGVYQNIVIIPISNPERNHAYTNVIKIVSPNEIQLAKFDTQAEYADHDEFIDILKTMYYRKFFDADRYAFLYAKYLLKRGGAYDPSFFDWALIKPSASVLQSVRRVLIHCILDKKKLYADKKEYEDSYKEFLKGYVDRYNILSSPDQRISI